MKIIRKFYQKHKLSIVFFLTVGALSALVNLLSFTFFWRMLGWDYRIAISCAYILSVITHFAGNRYLTFKSYHTSIFQQLPRYLSMVGINYSITLTLAFFVVDVLHASPYYGIFLGIVGTVATGYLLSYFWVFRLNRGKKCDIL